MKFTRRDIIRAIRTEPMKAGSWVSYTTRTKDGTCKVCAVGAVLRERGNTDGQICNLAWKIAPNGTVENEEIPLLLKNKDYISALSAKFEYLARKYGNGKRTKEKLVDFVKSNFPVSFNSLKKEFNYE